MGFDREKFDEIKAAFTLDDDALRSIASAVPVWFPGHGSEFPAATQSFTSSRWRVSRSSLLSGSIFWVSRQTARAASRLPLAQSTSP